MSVRDFDILKKHGIKTKFVAEKMGISESLLRYHLCSEMRYPKTKTDYHQCLLDLASELSKDVKACLAAEKKKK